MSSHPFFRTSSLSDWLIADHKALHALDDIENLFDLSSFEKPLRRVYPSKMGRPSHP